MRAWGVRRSRLAVDPDDGFRRLDDVWIFRQLHNFVPIPAVGLLVVVVGRPKTIEVANDLILFRRVIDQARARLHDLFFRSFSLRAGRKVRLHALIAGRCWRDGDHIEANDRKQSGLYSI